MICNPIKDYITIGRKILMGYYHIQSSDISRTYIGNSLMLQGNRIEHSYLRTDHVLCTLSTSKNRYWKRFTLDSTVKELFVENSNLANFT